MLPILYTQDNLLFTDNLDAFAVYKFRSEPYAYQPKHIKSLIIDRIIKTLWNLTGELYFYSLTQQLSIDEVKRSMRNFSKHPIWNAHCEAVQYEIEEMLPFNRIHLLVIPLQKKFSQDLNFGNLKDVLNEMRAGVKDVKNRMLRSAVGKLPVEKVERARKISKIWEHKLGTSITRANLRDIEWWLKKPYYRGLAEPEPVIPDPLPFQVISNGKDEFIQPHKGVFATLSEVYGKETPFGMTFDHPGDKKSHQTFFTSVQVPTNIPEEDSTGFEWIYGVLEQLYFPVDLALHLKIESPQKAQQGLKGKKKTAEAQYKEWTDNEEEAPEEIINEMQTAQALDTKLRTERQPLLHTRVIFGLGADNEDELERRVTEFKNTALSYHTLVRAPGDGKRMFQAFYPFHEELPSTWDIQMDPGVFAAAVPFGTKKVGDPMPAILLGYLSNNQVVWMNPSRPALELQKTNGILICGTLGSGKTVLLKDLCTLLSTWGAVGDLIDPKGDSDPLEGLNEYGLDVKVTRFTPDSKTRFSPFRIGGVQHTRAMLNMLFNSREDRITQIIISEAEEAVRNGTKWDMYAFMQQVAHIRDNHMDPEFAREAKILFELIRHMESHEIGRIFFGEDQGSETFRNQFNISIIRGVVLPDKDTPQEKWNESERISATIVYAVAALSFKRLIELPRYILKFLGIDEAWILRKFEYGRQLINEILRFSRSENLIPIIATQNPTDAEPADGEDDITGFFSWKFMLHLESQIQVKAALRILGMNQDNVEQWEKSFSDYSNGRGLVRDPEGRIGEIQVKVLPEDLLEFFKSTPGR